MRGMRSTYPHGPHQNRGWGPPPDPTSQLLGTLGESLADGLENLLSMVEQSTSLMRPMSGPMAPAGPWRRGRPGRWRGWEHGHDWEHGGRTAGQTAAAGVIMASGPSLVDRIAGVVATTRAASTTSTSTMTVTMTTTTVPGAGVGARVIVSPAVGAGMAMSVIAVANGAGTTATARAASRAQT